MESTEFQIATEELYTNPSKVVSINFVEWWLLKYGELYAPLKNKLPPLLDWKDKDGEYAFRKAYKTLEEISDYHRYEPVCKTALEEFQSIGATTFDAFNQKLLSWIINHETLGVEHLICFRIDYWGIEYEPEDSHLSHTAIPFSIVRSNFQNVIKFCDTFADIYWHNHEQIAAIFPDSLAARQNESQKNSQSIMVDGSTPPF